MNISQGLGTSERGARVDSERHIDQSAYLLRATPHNKRNREQRTENKNFNYQKSCIVEYTDRFLID